jgi:hypothetical protein
VSERSSGKIIADLGNKVNSRRKPYPLKGKKNEKLEGERLKTRSEIGAGV